MITTIELEIIKSQAHNIAVKHLEDDIKELNELITEKRDGEDEITQGQIDRDTLSHNSEDQENILILKQKLGGVKAQLDLLNKYQSAESTSIVDPGSLVFVQDQAFYVSTSVESFHHNGHKVTCISVEAPLYKAMRGLKSGDDFSCNGKSYNISKIA